MYSRCLLALLLLFSHLLKSQAGFSKAQLLQALQKPQPDSSLVDIYNELSWPVYSYDRPDSAIYFSNKAIALSKKNNDIKRLSIAHRRIGIAYINIGDFKNSIYNQEESYQLSEKIHFRDGMLKALNNLGVIYLNNDLVDKALTYFLKSLKIVEKTTDYSAIANLYNNCGLIYMKTRDYNRAKLNFRQAITFSKTNVNRGGLVELNCNLSAVFRNLNLVDSCKYYLDEAEKLLNENSNNKARYSFFIARGLYYSFINKNQLALESFLDCRKYTMNQQDEITLLINIGEEYAKLKNTERQMHYFKEAYQISLETKTYNNLMYLSFALARIHESQGNYSKYKDFMNLHLNFRDSDEKYMKVLHIKQQQLEFDYERKVVADSLKFVQKEQLKNSELAVAESELSKEKSFRIMLVLLLILVVIFAGFIYNRFFIIRKQSRIIELQKQIVDLKNHEILDSINYAKRLQSAILPQKKDIREFLDLDIFYLPKDIIGGDFYFYETHKQQIIFAVCDCTGHGIPGAIMSVVCHQALHKSIKEYNILEPGLVLSKTRELIIEQLNAANQNIKDGMDCSLIMIDTAKRKIKWAGANNPLWIWHKNTVQEIKGDKQPVALFENSREFTTHELDYLPETHFYLFTDGYADQFGGEKGKKFKLKQLKELLFSLSHLSPEKQTIKLRENFFYWKGELDQVDDVSVAVISV